MHMMGPQEAVPWQTRRKETRRWERDWRTKWQSSPARASRAGTTPRFHKADSASSRRLRTSMRPSIFKETVRNIVVVHLNGAKAR